MTNTEALLIRDIIETADHRCSHCIGELLAKLVLDIPEYDDVWRASKYWREDDLEQEQYIRENPEEC